MCGEVERKTYCSSSGRGGVSRNPGISWRRMLIILAMGVAVVVQAVTEAESKVVHIYE